MSTRLGLEVFVDGWLDQVRKLRVGLVASPSSVDHTLRHAVELLRHETTKLGSRLTSGEIDSVLWNRGAGARYKAIPRHRARSVFY